MNLRKVLRRLSEGHLNNVAFNDMRKLIEAFGLELKRVNGSHHVFAHPAIAELVNLQEVGAKPNPFRFVNSCDWSSNTISGWRTHHERLPPQHLL